jgi:periplasmic protein TonB
MKATTLLRISFIVIVMAFVGSHCAIAQDNSICTDPDIKPLYPGGGAALAKYLKENVKYPLEADSVDYTGTVCVSFIIEKSGGLTSIEISKGIGKGCDEEALRVVRKMPKWLAGSKGGKTVRVAYKLYVKFPQPE